MAINRVISHAPPPAPPPTPPRRLAGLPPCDWWLCGALISFSSAPVFADCRHLLHFCPAHVISALETDWSDWLDSKKRLNVLQKLCCLLGVCARVQPTLLVGFEGGGGFVCCWGFFFGFDVLFFILQKLFASVTRHFTTAVSLFKSR